MNSIYNIKKITNVPTIELINNCVDVITDFVLSSAKNRSNIGSKIVRPHENCQKLLEILSDVFLSSSAFRSLSLRFSISDVRF
jgi:hypothetical protein